MNNVQYFIKKNSPLILTIVSGIGVITTTIFAIKATPKALELIDEAEKEKGEKLTNIEKIKVGWKPYICTGISALSTILCIISIQYLNSKRQTNIISAYALLENAFKGYRNNIKELYTEEADKLAMQEIVKAQYDPDYEPIGDEDLFFDYQGMRFFKSTFDHVIQAEKRFKESLISRGYACINEYYDYLGIPRVDFGYQLGWADIENNDPYNVKELDFIYEETVVGGSVKCWIINTNMPATFDYII